MSNASRMKSKERASFLKKMGVERTTGMCPWGCGASIRNGGTHLLDHLRGCRGKRAHLPMVW